MATNTYFALTDGTTTLTFADGAGGSSWYKVQDGWAPRVAPLRNNQLGGRSPLDDVVEEVPITVTGSNAAHLYSNVSALNDLLTQSQRYARGEAVSGVTLNYSIRGGTTSGSATPFRALLLGRAGQSAMLELPRDFDSGGLHYKALNCRMRFLRRGQWVHTGGSQSGSTAAGSDSRVVTITMSGSASKYSPTLVSPSTNWTFKATSALGTGIIAITDSYRAADMLSIPVAPEAVSAPWTAVTGTSAQGGSVIRYTISDTSESQSASFVKSGSTYVGDSDNGYAVGVYANVFISSSSRTCNFRVSITSNGYGQKETAPVLIAPVGGSIYNACWYYLGAVPVSGSISGIVMYAQAGSAAGYIEIEQLLLVNPSKTNAVMFPNDESNVVQTGSLSVGATGLDLSPTASISGAQVSYSGDAYLTTGGSTLYVFQGRTYYAAGSTIWASGTHSVTIARYPSYATPR